MTLRPLPCLSSPLFQPHSTSHAISIAFSVLCDNNALCVYTHVSPLHDTDREAEVELHLGNAIQGVFKDNRNRADVQDRDTHIGCRRVVFEQQPCCQSWIFASPSHSFLDTTILGLGFQDQTVTFCRPPDYQSCQAFALNYVPKFLQLFFNDTKLQCVVAGWNGLDLYDVCSHLSKRPELVQQQHNDETCCGLELSPRGDFLAWVTATGNLNLASTSAPLAPVTCCVETLRITSLSFSRDSSTIAVGTWEDIIYLFTCTRNSASNECMLKPLTKISLKSSTPKPRNPPTLVCWLSDQELLASSYIRGKGWRISHLSSPSRQWKSTDVQLLKTKANLDSTEDAAKAFRGLALLPASSSICNLLCLQSTGSFIQHTLKSQSQDNQLSSDKIPLLANNFGSVALYQTSRNCRTHKCNFHCNTAPATLLWHRDHASVQLRLAFLPTSLFITTEGSAARTIDQQLAGQVPSLLEEKGLLLLNDSYLIIVLPFVFFAWHWPRHSQASETIIQQVYTPTSLTFCALCGCLLSTNFLCLLGDDNLIYVYQLSELKAAVVLEHKLDEPRQIALTLASHPSEAAFTVTSSDGHEVLYRIEKIPDSLQSFKLVGRKR
eukprot:m.53841 g.53841  ORF g.53841 m.53841 type:complete len:606 (-) comp18445_c0_seq2:69-1886(-)